MHYHRILIAIEHGARTARTTSLALDVARAHSSGPFRANDSGTSPESASVERFSSVERSDRPPLPSRGVHRGGECVLVGASAAEIIEAADRWKADLVILGSNSGTGESRGSANRLALALMRQARCTVLVVHPLAS